MAANPQVYQLGAEAGPPSFKATVIERDPEGYAALGDSDRLEIGNEFFNSNVANHPDFAGLSDLDKGEIRAEFINNQVLGNLEQRQASPLDIIPGLAAGLGESFSPIKPLFGQETFKASDFPIARDNPYYGGGAAVGNIAGVLDQGLLGAMAAGAAGVPAGLAAALGFGAPSAVRNIQSVQRGEQNPGQAIFNTGLDASLAGYAPAARTALGAAGKNALLGGAGGAVGAAGNQALSGQPLDADFIGDQAAREATLQGIIAGAISKAGGKPFLSQPKASPVSQKPAYKGRVVSQEAPASRLIEGTPADILQRNVLKRVAGAESIGAKSAVKQTRSQLENMYLAANTSPVMKARIQQLIEVVDAAEKRLNPPKDTSGVQKARIDKKKQDFRQKQIKIRVQESLKRQKELQSQRQKLITDKKKSSERESAKAEALKVRAEAKSEKEVQARQAKEQKAIEKERQAQEKVKAAKIAKAEAEEAQRQTLIERARIKQAVSDITDGMSAEEKAGIRKQFEAKVQAEEKASKQSTGVRPEKQPKTKPTAGKLQRSTQGQVFGAGLTINQVRRYIPDTAQGYAKMIDKAIKEGRQIRITVRTERVGETSTVPYRDVSPLGWKLAKSGDVFLEALNPNGQHRVYIMKKSFRKSEGHAKPPELLDTPALLEPLEDTGSPSPIPTSVREAAVKNLKGIKKRIDAGEPVQIRDIIDEASKVDEKVLEQFYAAMPERARKQLYKKISGKDC